MDGFVDEEVVRALLAGMPVKRVVAYQQDLILSANDNDFAGWQLQAAPSRVEDAPPLDLPSTPAAASAPPPAAAGPRRATPPSIEFASLKAPETKSHGRWLAALAGALTAAVILAVILSQYGGWAEIADFWPLSPSPAPAIPAPAQAPASAANHP